MKSLILVTGVVRLLTWTANHRGEIMNGPDLAPILTDANQIVEISSEEMTDDQLNEMTEDHQ